MALTYLRALRLFYRTVVPFTGVASVFIIGTAIMFGNWPMQLRLALVLMKLSTFPVIWYLSEQLRPHQYWLYLNLHLAPWQLWAAVVALDTLGFCGLVAVLHHLAP